MALGRARPMYRSPPTQKRNSPWHSRFPEQDRFLRKPKAPVLELRMLSPTTAVRRERACPADLAGDWGRRAMHPILCRILVGGFWAGSLLCLRLAAIT